MLIDANPKVKMEVESLSKRIHAPEILTALFSEFSAVTDYHTLRDSLPRRLAALLKCRCVLLYLRIGETLQLASGSFDDQPGWSSSLLAVAHINPISLTSDLPEAAAWRERHSIGAPTLQPTLVAMPLIYRHRAIGILTALRSIDQATGLDSGTNTNQNPASWLQDDLPTLDAIADVIALLLENTRLLEHDRERIHELSLLNSISNHLNRSMYDLERVRTVVIQRTREISNVDLCELLEPSTPPDDIPWLSPELRTLLFKRFQEQRSPAPLVIEQPGGVSNPHTNDYLAHLPTHIKTFFAYPLLSGRTLGRSGLPLLRGSRSGAVQETAHNPKVLGIVVGAYHKNWKLRRAEIVLLQVLASQASTVLENMYLVTEVVEARNEARKLLRKVLDDQRLKALILESIPSGLVTTDRKGRVTTFNRAAQVILGYHPYEVLGQPLDKFLNWHPSLAADPGDSTLPSLISSQPSRSSTRRQDALHDVLHTGNAQSGTLVTLDRQGQEIVLDVDTVPLRDDLGAQIGTLTTFTDVTSMHRLEEEKRRLDRLASLGEMAANVAHEVRNPLASIKTSMQILNEDLTSSESNTQQADWAQESISVVLKEVERLDTIVRELLLFARPRQLHRVKCNLPELSDRVLKLLQPQCTQANIVIHRIYDQAPPIWVDIGQMEQVLFNLYMNAIQAMPDGGTLTIASHLLSANHAMPEASTHQTPRNSYSHKIAEIWSPYGTVEQATPQWVEIVITDTGTGVPPDQLERIFQPFFTTKAHGIGLGLAITRRLIEDHAGHIRVEGHFGYGATIIVRLPLIHNRSITEEDDNE